MYAFMGVRQAGTVGGSLVRWGQAATMPGWMYAVGVGSNRGDRLATLVRAQELLAADGAVRVVHCSSWWRTAPVGGPAGQGDFLNGAWLVECACGPHVLLARLQGVEHACGRVRTIRWGPRTCDLDLLMRSDGLVVDSAVLHLPHPRLHQRAFVLGPLAEVAGDWRLAGRTIAAWAQDDASG